MKKLLDKIEKKYFYNLNNSTLAIKFLECKLIVLIIDRVYDSNQRKVPVNYKEIINFKNLTSFEYNLNDYSNLDDSLNFGFTYEGRGYQVYISTNLGMTVTRIKPEIRKYDCQKNNVDQAMTVVTSDIFHSTWFDEMQILFDILKDDRNKIDATNNNLLAEILLEMDI